MVFGLIDESGDRAGDGRHVDWVELYPDRLGFHEPWDGTYSMTGNAGTEPWFPGGYGIGSKS